MWRDQRFVGGPRHILDKGAMMLPNERPSLRDLINLLEGLRKPVAPEPIRLKGGRAIQPTPKSRKWRSIGAPVLLPIAELDLHPDGLSTAKSKWLWEPDYKHTNSEPVRAVMIDGQPHVLDGYHRVVQAARNGNPTIQVQIVE